MSNSAVAPYTGAWIEITHHLPRDTAWYRRTLHGCVDWNFQWITSSERHLTGRTLHGCVDWNFGQFPMIFACICRTLHGCVDWNKTRRLCRLSKIVAPYTGAWIEIWAFVFISPVFGCRTLHGCVDWNIWLAGTVSAKRASHPTRVRGLKSNTHGRR